MSDLLCFSDIRGKVWDLGVGWNLTHYPLLQPAPRGCSHHPRTAQDLECRLALVSSPLLATMEVFHCLVGVVRCFMPRIMICMVHLMVALSRTSKSLAVNAKHGPFVIAAELFKVNSGNTNIPQSAYCSNIITFLLNSLALFWFNWK